MQHFQILKTALFLSVLPLTATGAKDAVVMKARGMGWVKFGRIAHTTDTLRYNYSQNTFLGATAQITAVADINQYLQGALGIGAAQSNFGQGGEETVREVDLKVSPYITQARFTFNLGGRDEPLLKATFGMFPYNYNPNVKNLGLYLLRGSVYPGILFSGFERKEVMPRANIFGMNLRNVIGNFRHDIILNSETDLPPIFDFSLAYIAQYNFSDALNIGAGCNSYRLFPSRDALTNFSDRRTFSPRSQSEVEHIYDRYYTYIDAQANDTTWFSHRGVKLNVFYSLDLKRILGLDGRWNNDLLLYGEIALIGLNFNKGHKAVFGDIKNRMPVMIGFNLPTLGFLDHASLEVEWYGAKFRDDYTKIMDKQTVSPVPVSNKSLGRKLTPGDSIEYNGKSYPNKSPYNLNDNVDSDNWKWSLHAAKTLQGHFKISFQLANDHFRPGGIGESEITYDAALTTLKDWYWMTKVSFFF